MGKVIRSRPLALIALLVGALVAPAIASTAIAAPTATASTASTSPSVIASGAIAAPTATASTASTSPSVIASGRSGVRPETRVRGFELGSGPRVAGDRDADGERAWGIGDSPRGIASGCLLAAEGGLGRAGSLADDALVCRGGTCTAERFRAGSGVTVDEAGRLQGVSVNSAPGATLEQLTTTIPNKQVGVTTVGQVRAAGGNVIPSPTAGNPFHCTLCDITAEWAERLFTPTVRNPNVR